jgi:hypothetical protein
MLARVLPFLCVLACSTSPADGGAVDLLVRSDKPVYTLAADQSAKPLLINRGDRPVYLPMNEYVAVEHLEAGIWQQGIVWFVVDGDGISFRLDPGDRLAAEPMDFGYINREPGNTASCLKWRWILRVTNYCPTPRPAQRRSRCNPRVGNAEAA